MRRISEYVLTCIGGLEEVAEEEVQACLGRTVTSVRSERGAAARVFLRTEISPRRLLALRCPTGLFVVAAQAHDVTVGTPGRERVGRCLRQVPLEAVRRMARACAPGIDTERVRLRVSVRGAHRFTAVQIEADAQVVLQEGGLEVTGEPGQVLELGVHVRKRRALVTVRLGPVRPVGDPLTEGWAGPALHCVERLLDLDPSLLVATVPARHGTAGVWLRQGESAWSLCGQPGDLPLAQAAVPVLLCAPPTAAAETRSLAEAARIVVPGGIAGFLVRRAEGFSSRLRVAGLPFEVMAGLPYYARRRRQALFLLERLDLVRIEGV